MEPLEYTIEISYRRGENLLPWIMIQALANGCQIETMPHDLLGAKLNLECLYRLSVPFKTESDPIQHQGQRS
jgi:hypothetical protein